MLHKPLFIANWKMNLDREGTEELLDAIKRDCKFSPKVTTVVCPSFVNIPQVAGGLGKTPLRMGAQDVSWQESGSLTGEVSPLTLRDYGVEYVLVGHSERREHLGETDEMINGKIKACLSHDIIPVLCVGETFEERQEGKKDHVIRRQVEKALAGVKFDKHHSLCIAYEPVWVIGSGQAVDPKEAAHTAEVIKQEVFDQFHTLGKSGDELVTILYGGSVQADNVASFITGTIRGVLVGGASLTAATFCDLLERLDRVA